MYCQCTATFETKVTHLVKVALHTVHRASNTPHVIIHIHMYM